MCEWGSSPPSAPWKLYEFISPAPPSSSEWKHGGLQLAAGGASAKIIHFQGKTLMLGEAMKQVPFYRCRW